MRFLFALLFLVFFAAFPALSQSSLEDSLRQRFNNASLPDSLRAEAAAELVSQLVYSVPDQADSVAQEALQLPDILPKQIPVLITRRAISFAVRGQTGRSISLFEQTAEAYRRLGDSLAYAGGLHNLAMEYARMGQYEKSIEKLKRSLAIKQGFPDAKLAAGLAQMGIIYSQLKQPQSALLFFRKALQRAHKEAELGVSQHEENVASGYGNLGIWHLEQKNYDSAYYYRQKSYEVYTQTGNLYYVLLACNDLSEIFLGLDQPDSAKKYLAQTQKISQQMQAPEFIGRSYLSQAAYFLHIGQADSARQYYAKAETLGQEKKILSLLHDTYKNIADWEEMHGKATEAVTYLKKFIHLSDSLRKQESQEQIVQLGALYETAEKEREIERQKQENQLQAAEIQRQNWQLVSGGLALLLLGGLVFWVARARQRERKTNALLRQKNEEIQTQRDEIQTQAEELQQTNAQLITLSNFKEAVTGMAAHDLKNPLNTILNLSENPSVRQAGWEMMTLVQNMLDVQKFENARLEIHPTPAAVQAILDEALHQTAVLTSQKRLDVQTQVPEGLTAKVDVALLTRVLVNLLSNATKFTPPGGEITVITALIDEAWISLEVCDTGDGFPAGMEKKLFDKYYQAKARESGKAQSTGLGLTFCKFAVEAHGGEIEAENRATGGACFRLRLPKAEEDVSYTKKKLDDAPAPQKHAVDTAQVKPYAEALREIPVYEYTKITEILSPLEEQNSEAKTWKKQVLQAAILGDEEGYDELLQRIVEA